tara:strand:- start:1270 stop:2238 length:969 start_codon:yes stop_codon:yes gene_type:complete
MSGLDLSQYLETRRLFFRQIVPGDATDLVRLNAPIEVLEYTTDEPFKNEDEARAFAKAYPAYSTPTPYGHPLGRWGIINKEDNEFIGWCGLKWHPQEKVVDLGYRIIKDHWGKGYATEAASACIDIAFTKVKLRSLVAHAHVNNIGSQKVLLKNGCIYIKDTVEDGIPIKVYKIDNPLYTVKTIAPQKTWEVRHPVLRAGKPLESCAFNGDELETTFHLGVFYDRDLVGVSTFMENPHPAFAARQLQLRGMGVLPEYQKRGLGEMMMDKALAFAKEKNIHLLWCNAREVAVSFYKNLGFKIKGEPFDIPEIGPHHLMFKELD